MNRTFLDYETDLDSIQLIVCNFLGFIDLYFINQGQSKALR